MIQTFRDILIGIGTTAKGLFSTNGLLAKGAIALFMYFAGLHTYLLIIMALVMIDVILGLAASMKTGVPFSSRKLRKGLLEKLLLYLMLLITVFFIDQLFVKDFGFTRLFFSFFITFLISVYEATSIIENLAKIRPDIPFLTGLRGIFKKMGDKAMSSMENKTDSIVNTVTDIQNITVSTNVVASTISPTGMTETTATTMTNVITTPLGG